MWMILRAAGGIRRLSPFLDETQSTSCQPATADIRLIGFDSRDRNNAIVSPRKFAEIVGNAFER